MLDQLHWKKANKFSKPDESIKITQDVIKKKTPAGCKTSILTYIVIQNSTKTTIFIATKQEKTNLEVI